MAEVKDYSAEALLRKEKEVELDTDDVKETDVEIKETEKPKDETPNLKVSEEVDLGYTDHPQKDEKKEEKPQIEIKEDDPQPEVSRETSEKKLRKIRIKNLIFKSIIEIIKRELINLFIELRKQKEKNKQP